MKNFLYSKLFVSSNLFGCRAIIFKLLSSSLPNKVENENIVPVCHNRNPRNLELLGFLKKRKGWRFQYPSKQFYNKLVFNITHRHVEAHVEHYTGRVIASASTKEMAISSKLYSCHDVSAAENIGRILANRCLKFGLTSMILSPPECNENSEKFVAFKQAFEAGGVSLSERAEYINRYEPGLPYDDKEAMEDMNIRRNRVANSYSNVVKKRENWPPQAWN